MASQPANPPLDDKLLEEIHADSHTNTGIENKKLIMWLFLASDCMFFGTLISTHLIYRKLYPFGHPQEGAVDITGTFDIELTSFSTFILLMSSFLMALAVSAMHKGAIESFRRYTFGVIIFGLIFLGGQVYEFQHFFHGQGWYQWKAENTEGQMIFGNESNLGLFHDVADTGAAKEGFAHEHLGLKLIDFEAEDGAELNGGPIPFTFDLEMPKDSGDPLVISGQYLFVPKHPEASQVIIQSNLPAPPADKKKEAAKEDEGAEKAAAAEDGEGETAEKTASTEAEKEASDAHASNEGDETKPQAPEEASTEAPHKPAHAVVAQASAPESISAAKAMAKDYFKHSNYGFEVTEFKQVKVVPGLSLQTSVFGSTFYVMTGTHGTHVAIGILWLFSMLIFSYSGRLTPRNAIDVEIAGLYWHFVDIVWIVIFTAVYLVEYIEL
ncbi:cytochrome c oxidase subunit 3 [Cerasicoccus frondis]|uniref:cytochrome c oxidase subunit 3 n=1 Tax=Cerasicoccus frondis TaxID=490090 RepID=UPI002852A3A5|nr:cytochrome c oxidase subunit 3 [Cerasicoccus frondis]